MSKVLPDELIQHTLPDIKSFPSYDDFREGGFASYSKLKLRSPSKMNSTMLDTEMGESTHFNTQSEMHLTPHGPTYLFGPSACSGDLQTIYPPQHKQPTFGMDLQANLSKDEAKLNIEKLHKRESSIL